MKTAAEVWARLTLRQRAKLIFLDKMINVLLGDYLPGPTIPGQTMSTRFALSKDRGEWAGIKACEILDTVDYGHCERALQYPQRAA